MIPTCLCEPLSTRPFLGGFFITPVDAKTIPRLLLILSAPAMIRPQMG